MYQKTWATKNKRFFRGDEDRPITESEKAAVYILAGATLMLVAIKLYYQFRIALWF